MGRHTILSALIVFLCVGSRSGHATIVLTSISPSHNEDFDGLASAGTSSIVPAFWSFSELGPNADATYAAESGGSVIGDTYSFGSDGMTDRAFGTLRSGTIAQFVSTIGAAFSNGGTSPIESLAISYRGEQWRLGFTDDPPRTDQLDFQYSFDATSLTSGTWINLDALDFVSPKIIGPTGALDGNLSANSTILTATISGLAIAPSGNFWIRWTDFNAIASDDGLAVDDFNITATYAAVPEPGAHLFGLLAGGLAVGAVVLRRISADRWRNRGRRGDLLIS